MAPRTVAAVALLAAAHPQAGVAALQRIAANDAAFVSWSGRAYAGAQPGSVAYQWLGGTARVAHNGTVLKALVSPAVSVAHKLTFSQGNEGYWPWQGSTWVIPNDAVSGVGLTIGVGPGEVRVSPNQPPQYWAQAAPAEGALLGFETNGAFLPVAPPAQRRVMHFLGDSITAATNVHGGVLSSCHDGGYEADWAASYSGQLCSWFDAECSVIAVGGKGLVRNCCDNGTLMPDFYTRARYTDPANGSFNFTADAAPDVFVIYLGTNDFDKGVTPALTAQFTAAMVQFMKNVTQLWYGTPAAPANTTFLAVLGPMSPTAPAQAITDAVAQGTAAGLRVQLLNVTTACGPSLTGCTDGCATHPGARSHRIMADMAAPVIAQITGWTPPSQGPFPWEPSAAREL